MGELLGKCKTTFEGYLRCWEARFLSYFNEGWIVPRFVKFDTLALSIYF